MTFLNFMLFLLAVALNIVANVVYMVYQFDEAIEQQKNIIRMAAWHVLVGILTTLILSISYYLYIA